MLNVLIFPEFSLVISTLLLRNPAFFFVILAEAGIYTAVILSETKDLYNYNVTLSVCEESIK